MKKILIIAHLILLNVYANAQQGTVEYKMTMARGGQSQSTTSTMYFSNGNVRTDVSIPMPGTTTPMKQSILFLAASPNTIYTLNDASKTYSETKTDKTPPQSGATIVKVLGKEKIQNLNCTHAMITLDKGSMEVWTSKDIPGYDKLLSYWNSNNSLGGAKMLDELKKNGADGFFVRMKNSGITTELVRYDLKAVDASLFEIPKEYKKRDHSGFGNMSPADRKKMIDAYKKQQKP
ncbi:DUF4412 domain-containing protein [Larkinella rosea]|nr:DUF4412 domain-containing protein [Larkinella rosea]